MVYGQHGVHANSEPDTAGITFVELNTMMRLMLQHQSLVLNSIKYGMVAAQFYKAEERPFYILFEALAELLPKHKLATPAMLTTTIQAWIAEGYISGTDNAVAFLLGDPEDKEWPGFIAAAVTAAPGDEAAAKAERRYLEHLISQFLAERHFQRDIPVSLGLASGGVVDIRTQLNEWSVKAANASFLGREVTSSADMPSIGGEIQLPPSLEVTGLPWIDEYLGGVRAGDMLGCMGPTGGGKTTLLCVMAVRMAQNYYARQQNKLSVFIGYEEGSSKMAYMFWSAAAHIARERFMNLVAKEDGSDAVAAFWASLSDSTRPYDYDLTLPENKNGKIILGERERWELTQDWYNKHFVFLDFSSNSSAGDGYGSGGVPEIISVLNKLREDRNADIGFVGIDYAGLLMNRYLGTNNATKHKDQIWREMQNLPDELRTQVAENFKAVVFLAHQLAGGDTKKIPVYRYTDHLCAQGSKAFAENLRGCLCINRQCPKTRVSTINWSKIRSSVPVNPYGLVRQNFTYVDMLLVNDEYVASETTRSIVKRGETGLVVPSGFDAAAGSAFSAKKKEVSLNAAPDKFGAALVDE